MITKYEQLQALIKKYGEHFNLQQAIELEKKLVTTDAK